MKNNFLKSIYQYATTTENGAISHASTGSALLDYFSKCGTYRDRDLEAVFADMSRIWSESPLLAMQIIFYNRMVSRKVKGLIDSEKVQKGQGNRSEFRKSLIWLARYQPELLTANLWLVPVVGTWKDLWHEDLLGELDNTAVYALIKRGIADEYNKDLIAKYLPRIRSKSNTYNERHKKLNRFAFGLLKYLKWSPVDYRTFKAAGKAHDFQKQMCWNNWAAINFNSIPGKALFSLVNKKGKDELTTLQRHEIEDTYTDWILKQPTAKFTGYVYELMNSTNTSMNLAQKTTIDKQFEGLLELAKKDAGGIKENIWCALDTSGSMMAQVANTTAFNVCISLGIYFSSLNEGAFKDHVVMFDNKSRVLKLTGSFTDKVQQIRSTATAWGSTNFQSVIEEIVRVRKEQPHIPVEDFPTTLVVVSDMQFNPAGNNMRTNYEAAMYQLREVGLPNIRIVWWWVTGRGADFPNQLDEEGVVLIGGFDGSILSLLIGGEEKEIGQPPKTNTMTPYDMMLKALNQEVLQAIRVGE